MHYYKIDDAEQFFSGNPLQDTVVCISLSLLDGSIHKQNGRYGFTELFLICPIFRYVAQCAL